MLGKQKTKSDKARTVLRLLAQPIMNMGTKENTKKAFALMMSTVMLAATGCEAIEISSKKAEQIVVHNLEEKYGGTFEVRSVEKKNKGVNAFKDHVYEMEVYSDELCETFTVEIYRNGENMADNYEEYFYRKQVTDELNSILEEEDGYLKELSHLFLTIVIKKEARILTITKGMKINL